MFMNRLFLPLLFPLLAWPVLNAHAQDLHTEARTALRKATAFFHGQVAVEGGYVYKVSDDLKKREGEGKVGTDEVWVQPPGTPTVGTAFTTAWELTGDPACKQAARDAVDVLLRGQYASGGWNASIHLGDVRHKHAYRVDHRNKDGSQKPPAKNARNYSSLDDDKTTAALRCLMRYDRVAKFEDKAVHEAAEYALDALLAAQHPSGGWPQVFSKAADADAPVKRAAYPPGEPTRIKEYWNHLTLNDGNIDNAVDTLFLAFEIYDEPKYKAAALRAGDFLIRAQMPEPQPGWAQQYDAQMQPAWARKFEPASITGGESQRAMQTLLDLYQRTGDPRFLEPHKTALPYYRRSLLPDNKLARFYELKTNRPLYLTRDYKVTYDDSDMPTHYAFKVSSKIDRIEQRWKTLRQQHQDKTWTAPAAKPPKPPSAKEVRRLIDNLDQRGAWVEDGQLKYWGKGDDTRRVIRSETFAKNLVALARLLAESPKTSGK